MTLREKAKGTLQTILAPRTKTDLVAISLSVVAFIAAIISMVICYAH